MSLRLDGPHVVVITRDGDHFALPPEAHLSVLTAWLAGEAFWQGIDLWGQPFAIKLAAVTLIALRTPESCALLDAEDEEKRQRSMMRGDEE